jgi:hypothetical protein
MYFTIYKSENGNNLLKSSASSITPPPKSYVAGYIDLPTPEHIEVIYILIYLIFNSFT